MKSLFYKDHARIESAFCPLPTITANGEDKYSAFFKKIYESYLYPIEINLE